MAIESNHRQVQFLLKELLADPCIYYTSVLTGILACKIIYDCSQLLNAMLCKGYSGLSKLQRVEWNNRVISTLHAIFITVMALYFVFWSDLFSYQRIEGLITVRYSPKSIYTLGVSVGYFLSDLGMIIYFYPSLGGMEYVIHHILSVMSVAYSMITGEAQIYTFMVLISEATTPSINLRWYLDAIGLKGSQAYVINGVVMFLAWLVARILLFVYFFFHLFLHYDQVKPLRVPSKILVCFVPVVLSVLNLAWFGKIIKGMKKALAKRE